MHVWYTYLKPRHEGYTTCMYSPYYLVHCVLNFTDWHCKTKENIYIYTRLTAKDSFMYGLANLILKGMYVCIYTAFTRWNSQHYYIYVLQFR
jgi:hypothetical protein